MNSFDLTHNTNISNDCRREIHKVMASDEWQCLAYIKCSRNKNELRIHLLNGNDV